MTTRSWTEVTPVQQRLLLALFAVEVALFVAAQVDLARRPAELVAGSKAKWRLLTAVNLVGPLAYFLRGRRPPTHPHIE